MRPAQYLKQVAKSLPGAIEVHVASTRLCTDKDLLSSKTHYFVSIETTPSCIPIAPELDLTLVDGTRIVAQLEFGTASQVSQVLVQSQKIRSAGLRLAQWGTDRTVIRAEIRPMGNFEQILRSLLAAGQMCLRVDTWKRVVHALGLDDLQNCPHAFLEAIKLVPTLHKRGAQMMLQLPEMPADYWHLDYSIRMSRAIMANDKFSPFPETHRLLIAPGTNIPPYAEMLFARAIERTGADLLYGDNISRNQDPDGDLTIETRFPFSPEYFKLQPDLGGAVAVRRDLLSAESIKDYNLQLRTIVPRVVSDGKKISYVKAILSERTESSEAASAQPMQRSLGRAKVLEEEVSATVVIPTKNSFELLKSCLTSIGALQENKHLNVVIVQNNTDDRDAIAFLETLPPHIEQVSYTGGFNYAAIMNLGSAHATQTPYLIHLNDDTELIEPDALLRLCKRTTAPDVGIVGPLLLFPNGLIQHAGIELMPDGTCKHIGILEPHLDPDSGAVNEGYQSAFIATREVSALTGACVVMRRDVFNEVGGYDEALAVTYNDVDLCLTLRQRGYRVLYDGSVAIRHHTSASRGRTIVDPFPGERSYFIAKHGCHILGRNDPFSPGLGRLVASQIELFHPHTAVQIALDGDLASYSQQTH